MGRDPILLRFVLRWPCERLSIPLLYYKIVFDSLVLNKVFNSALFSISNVMNAKTLVLDPFGGSSTPCYD